MLACMYALSEGRCWASVEDARRACLLCKRAIEANVKTAAEIDKSNPDYTIQDRIQQAIVGAGEDGISQRELSRSLRLSAEQVRRYITGLKEIGTVAVENVQGTVMVRESKWPSSATRTRSCRLDLGWPSAYSRHVSRTPVRTAFATIDRTQSALPTNCAARSNTDTASDETEPPWSCTRAEKQTNKIAGQWDPRRQRAESVDVLRAALVNGPSWVRTTTRLSRSRRVGSRT